MNIVFTKNYKVQDKEGVEYKEGDKADMSPESAAHFINKGVAEYQKKVDKKAKAEADKEAKADKGKK